MELTLFGISIEVKPEQSPKAKSPIEVTLFEMVMELKSLQDPKAELPIDDTPCIMITFSI